MIYKGYAMPGLTTYLVPADWWKWMKRVLALILSLVYCGFGQIYKGEVLKGINFAIVYTALILSLIFLSSISLLAQLILISLLMLMWLTGMIDAYADEETFIEGVHGLLWKTLIMVLIVVGFFGSVITVTTLIIHPQVFMLGFRDTVTYDVSGNKTTETKKANSGLQGNVLQNQVSRPRTNEKIQEKPVQSSNNPKDMDSEEVEKDTESEMAGYYSIQVGAFSKSDLAENLVKQLKEKGYSVRVISPLPDENPALYKVQVGKFDTRDGATRISEKLGKYEGITGTTILLMQ